MLDTSAYYAWINLLTVTVPGTTFLVSSRPSSGYQAGWVYPAILGDNTGENDLMHKRGLHLAPPLRSTLFSNILLHRDRA